MTTNLQITIIGVGSAEFSAGLVTDLCVSPGLHGCHVVLMDIDQQRLDMVYRLAERITAELKVEMTLTKTTDRVDALKGADFVINTAQMGVHPWTEAQRSMAEKYGYYRGARMHDIPQMKFFMDVALDMEHYCPNAWVIQCANPVFEGCTLMNRATKIKVLGLCHGHYGYQDIARTLGLELEHVSAQMPGFNHWIWMTDFRHKGKDAYPLLDEWIETQSEQYWATHIRAFHDNQMSPAAIHQYKLFGLMPIGDTPRFVGWWYHTDLETKKRWFGPEGGFDSEIGWQHHLDYVDRNVKTVERVALDEETPVAKTFTPVLSEDIPIIQIINGLVNDVTGTFQVNIPNRGPIIKGFPENLVIECQGLVSGAGIRGVNTSSFPEKLYIGALVPRWQRAELAVEALRTRDLDMLLLFLLHDHRTRNLEQAEAFLEEWLGDPRNVELARWFGR